MKRLTLVLVMFVVYTMGCGSSQSPVGGSASNASPTTGGAGAVPAGCPTQAPAPIPQGFVVPCPTNNTAVPQVLFVSGQNVLSVGAGNTYHLMAPGQYVSTDGRSCSFTINADGSIQ
jgi:hypothetical protein